MEPGIPSQMFGDTFAWLEPAGRLLLIVVGAWLLRRLVKALIAHLEKKGILPVELVVALRRLASTVITTAALLLILEQLGVSATVLWTALTGFLAVAAIAFFAGWSVLSNTFCTLLIVTTRPFRLHDYIEILENGEKPGLRGQVIDINLIYTTLREQGPEGTSESVLQVPNSLFFQRVVRRWRNGTVPQRQVMAAVDSPPAAAAGGGKAATG
nr:MAG: mechanosensitive ion channel protein MscS [Pseudomonadota bacterium]